MFHLITFTGFVNKFPLSTTMTFQFADHQSKSRSQIRPGPKKFSTDTITSFEILLDF